MARLPLECVKIVTRAYPEDRVREIVTDFLRTVEGAGIREIREGTPLREFGKDVATLHATRDRYEARQASQ
ncbi:MAG: hypothetical protein ACP5G7_07230 [Anaerolineae bacterium]